MTNEKDHAKEQAAGQLESIIEKTGKLKKAELKEDDSAKEEAVNAIQEDALDVQIRCGWHTPSEGERHSIEEYYILLCTGGPAVRIIGEIGGYDQPSSARLEYQDWGTPWIEYQTTNEEKEALQTYAEQFYFTE